MSNPLAATLQNERRITLSVFLVTLAFSVLLAHPADARSTDMRCSSWTNLAEEQKLERVNQLIEDAIRSPSYRQYVSFNRIRVKRCLESLRPQLLDDFDELCSRRMREGLQAMNRKFRTYTWSCIY